MSLPQQRGLTLERLNEVLEYHPNNPARAPRFTRRVLTSNRVKIGDIAGRIGDGYRLISIDGQQHYEHHLVWFIETGAWPTKELDHKNTVPGDNRFENLREATRSQNEANKPLRCDNTSGLKGVSWDRRRKLWRASIRVNGRHIFLGYFDCKAAAHFIYVIAADKHFGKFARAA